MQGVVGARLRKARTELGLSQAAFARALGFSSEFISFLEAEKSAGGFNADLVAEDEAGNPVIIQNQLEKSDHDHLGKIITYLTAIDAKTAIWIVTDPRPEHVAAINWLNESSAANFYLIKVEGIRIGNSEPAPLLTLIVGPSEESRKAGETKKEMAERYKIRLNFWKALLEKAKEKTKLHAHLSPQPYSWIGTGAGKSGLGFNYSVTQHESKVELYIDRGKDAEKENKAIFDQLATHKKEIEETFGGALTWERLDMKRASRICKRIETGGYRDTDRWGEIQEKMIEAMIRLEKALRPYIANLKI
ncbi:MAG: DUF4268 domain-containing protein [Clostridiales bacterium]|nr:DUF4268 domain-containing protein [Clostridiales bacterium]